MKELTQFWLMLLFCTFENIKTENIALANNNISSSEVTFL